MQEWAPDNDIPYLERPYEYDGQAEVSICMWEGAARRSDQLARLEEWADFLSTPQPIVMLRLAGWVNDRMLRSLAPQTQLTGLYLHWGRYADLSPLTALRSLEVLSLGGATSLADLTPLMSLSRLEELQIEAGPNLRDYGPVGSLTGLRYLDVGVAGERKTTADSLDFVRHLHQLRAFAWSPAVAGNDYSPLLALHGVDDIWLWERKVMHPSIEELTKALPGLARQRRAREDDVTLDTLTRDGAAAFWADADDEDEGFEDDAWHDRAVRGPVAGTVFRTFTRTARTRSEHFWMRLTSPVVDGDPRVPPPPERIVDRCAFEGDAAGPLLLWDSPLPRAASGDVEDWFGGNTERWSPGPQPTEIDATRASPLTDDEFWPFIDLIGARFDGVMVFHRFDRELAARGEAFALRWTQTLGLLCVRGLPAAKAIVASDRTLHGEEFSVLGSIIGGGRENFERYVDDPASWSRPKRFECAYSIVHLGQSALKDGRGHIRIVTSFSPELRRAEEAAHLEESFDWEDEGETSPWLATARAVVRIDGDLRERLVAFDVTGIDEAHREGAAGAVVRSFGGEIVAGPELMHTGSLDGSQRMFTIRRRSSLPDDDYLARYSGN